MQYADFTTLIDKYDVFLIDIWGVLHDGSHIYTGSHQFLHKLKQHNKHVCLLSNMPRRASACIDILSHFGFTSEHYDNVLTSGEFFYHQYINNQNIQQNVGSNIILLKGDQQMKKKFLHSNDIVDDLGLYRADTPQNAHSVIASSVYHTDLISNSFPQLKIYSDANLPLICLNPDKKVVRQNGEEYRCAGAISEYYTNVLNGTVHYFGKPYIEIYHYIFNNYQNMHNKNRILAIGDGPYTDILGAQNAGIDSLLILDGILKKQMQKFTSRQDILKAATMVVEDLEQQLPTFIASNLAMIA